VVCSVILATHAESNFFICVRYRIVSVTELFPGQPVRNPELCALNIPPTPQVDLSVGVEDVGPCLVQ